MRSHCDALVEQALLVSNELIRVAILWGEMWHESLEQAYRRYFYYEHHGVDAMLSVLAPLYRLLEQGPATANERAFVAAHGDELQVAYDYCNQFSLTGNEAHLQLAWERFYTVLRQLGRELQEAKTLQLEQASPHLTHYINPPHLTHYINPPHPTYHLDLLHLTCRLIDHRSRLSC
jgi:serine/threonine-protein kinase mTOR